MQQVSVQHVWQHNPFRIGIRVGFDETLKQQVQLNSADLGFAYKGACEDTNYGAPQKPHSCSLTVNRIVKFILAPMQQITTLK